MTLSEELTWRKLYNQTTYKDLKVLDQKPITFYWGVDPSSDSMTIGNLAAAMMVKTFIKHGHKPVLLVGGATGLIGDPDGKNEERPLISIEELNKNKDAIVKQYHQLFGTSGLKVVDNHDWFKDLTYLSFLRGIGKHVPLRQMLARDFIDSRLSEAGKGISYAEFSYVLIQAYDFLTLFEKHNVRLQVCGSDQWGNSIAGVDLIRRKTGGEADVYSAPLVVNKSTGQKFGKTESGAIWLDPNKTSPTQFYQFWINVEDEAVEDYLKIFTELDKEAIDKIMTEHKRDTSLRIAQTALAEEVTTIVHGKSETLKANEITDYITGKKPLADADHHHLDQIRQELASLKVGNQDSVIDALVKSGLTSSNTEARRLVNSNAISINGRRINRENFTPEDFTNGRLLLRRGKAFKDSALIELG